MGSAAAERRGRDAADEIGEEQAAGQFERNLHPCCGGIVFHAKELEADGEKQRIARQPNQSGIGSPVPTVRANRPWRRRFLAIPP